MWRESHAYEVAIVDYHQDRGMIPTNRIPTHPGVILLEEFLEPMGITQVDLAAHIGVPVQRINEIVRGKRGISTETAWLLSDAFGTTPQLWMNLQMMYDIVSQKPDRTVPPLRDAS